MLILIGALVVGVIAALLIFQYVGHIEEKAQGSTRTEKVLVAIAPIAKGSVSTGLVDLADRRVADLPQDAVTRVDDIKSQIASINVAPGTVITASMFVNPDALKDSNAEILEKGMTAITVSFDAVKGVAGLVKPGDYVNILANNAKCTGNTISDAGSTDPQALNDPGANASKTCSTYIYQKVKVLAIGRSFGGPVAATPAADGAPTTTAAPVQSDQVTFSVPAEAAQNLSIFNPGSLYLTLVRDDYEPHPILPTLTPFTPLGALGQTPVGGDPEKTGAAPQATPSGGK